MKFKKWCFVSVSLILLSFLSGCNKEHIHNLEENYETSETHHFKKCLYCGEVVINEEHHLLKMVILEFVMFVIILYLYLKKLYLINGWLEKSILVVMKGNILLLKL